ncbi:MAG: tetratricopeptide repeat protein [Planctomycetota bacterium]|jgi:tetratricopeptide (TPR) repeat protein
MTTKDNLEEKLEGLGQAIGSDESLIDNVMSSIDTRTIAESNRAERRFTMSRFMKLAAAAVIIVAVVLSIVVVDKLASPAYAIDQTIEAFKNVQYMHIIQRDRAGNTEDERWIEIGSDGIQARYRQDTPERNFFVVDNRQTVMVHHPDKNTTILYDANEKSWTWIYAPGKLFQELADGGPGYYTVEENVQYKGRPAHHLRWVIGDTDIYIDPDTKLPIAHGDYEIDYEYPPEGTFDIVIPDGVILVDKRPGAEPASEPQWMIEEKEKEELGNIAQGYFEEARLALASGDYAKAVESFNKTIEISGGGRNWAWLWMGKALYEAGDYDAAIYRLSKVIDMIADVGWTIPSYNFARALAYQAKGMTDMARLDFEKALPKMILALREVQAASSFDLADDPLIRADGMREGCHEGPSKEQSLAMMINRLRIITGQNFGYDPVAGAEVNEQVIAAWEDWFNNSGLIKFTPDAELVAIPAE